MNPPNTYYASAEGGVLEPYVRLNPAQALWGSASRIPLSLPAQAPDYPYHPVSAPLSTQIDWNVLFPASTLCFTTERPHELDNVLGFQCVSAYCSALSLAPAGTTHFAVRSSKLMANVLNAQHRRHPTTANVLGLFSGTTGVSDVQSNAVYLYPNAQSIREIDISIICMPGGTTLTLAASESITIGIRLLTRTGPSRDLGAHLGF